jgi:transmembrane sensor
MANERLYYLLEKYFEKSYSSEEKAELIQLFASKEYEADIKDWIDKSVERPLPDYEQESATREDILQAILQQRPVLSAVQPAHRIHFLRRSWFRYAAAVVILIGATTIAVFMFTDRQQNPQQKDVAAVVPSGILPGTNKAVLTVDNQKIDLSSGKTGISVGKTIAYNDGEKLTDPGAMMMLATPRGGQYQVVLPDGTKAWLNAASSIRFPAAFKSEKRQIKITGEVYLEVAKDRSKPFMVDVDGKSVVEVLGTVFNINAYGDEGEIKTTLVEGSVRTGGLVLKPGQQATIDDKQAIKISSANIDQTLAWKNGIFNFNGKSFQLFMKELERWYDIDVKYEGVTPPPGMNGEMDRGVQLSDLIRFLESFGYQTRLEGRMLVIKGK